MARILITGSSDGIGQAAAKLLVQRGHKVTLHARNESRAAQAEKNVPGVEGVIIADLSTIPGAKDFAEKANKAGPWDTVVHNAGLGPSSTATTLNEHGYAPTFTVNSFAPYIITSLMEKPKRLLYLTSGLHMSADTSLQDIAWQKRPIEPFQIYCDTKLHDVLLANVVARRWKDVQSCSLNPGWVKTKMGGSGAPGSVDSPAKAIADYASGEQKISGTKSGVYLEVTGPGLSHKAALDTAKQDEFIRLCEELSGVKLPLS